MGFHTMSNTLARMNSVELFLYTLVEFFVFLVLIAVMGYALICYYAEKHRLGGTVDISVALWENVDSKMLPLHYGCFPILVKDSDDQEMYPFFPQRSWLERGRPRVCSVRTFLGRFAQAFEKTIGLESDESLFLLKGLLEDSSFQSKLGFVYPGKKGALGYFGTSTYQRDEASQRVIHITCPLPRTETDANTTMNTNTAADEFSRKTGCDVRTLQITLEWKP